MTEQELRATAQREAKDFLELLWDSPHADTAYPQQMLMHMLMRYHSEGAVFGCEQIARRLGVHIGGLKS